MNNHPRYVLIIEDNVHHAELLTEILDRHFAPVIIHTVDTFEDGIEFMAQSHYDLILSDGFSGDTIITNYTDQMVAQARGAPIIVITGRGDEALAARLAKRGISEYLVKTKETLDALPKILQKHISRRAKRPRTGKIQAVKKDAPSTPADVAREMETIKEQVLRLSSAMIGWKKRGIVPDLSEFEKIREHLKQIQKMAEKV